MLSRQTGFKRDYNRNPYVGYEDISGTYFPINHHDSRLSAKTWVIGLSLGERHKACPMTRLIKTGSHQERWGERDLIFEINDDAIQVRDANTDQVLPVARLYWFAWSTFHPDTDL